MWCFFEILKQQNPHAPSIIISSKIMLVQLTSLFCIFFLRIWNTILYKCLVISVPNPFFSSVCSPRFLSFDFLDPLISSKLTKHIQISNKQKISIILVTKIKTIIFNLRLPVYTKTIIYHKYIVWYNYGRAVPNEMLFVSEKYLLVEIFFEW